MASRLSRRIWPISIAALALAVAAVLVPKMASATPDNPTPASVQRQLDALSVKNSQLVDQYDHARSVAVKYQKQADAAKRAADRANAAFQAALKDFSATVTAQYEGGSFSATGALLSSESGASYLDRLNTLSMMNTHTSGVLAQITGAEKAASQAAKKARTLLKAANKKSAALAGRKTDVEKQIGRYQSLLDTLTAAQRAAYQQASSPTVSTQVSPRVYAGGTAAARKAVQFALAQVGKPYVFGAAGPDAYDCSGLTMAAWASAGVSLPHSAADQYNYGRHVSVNALQPGDLIFLYQPIGHVEIYIGGGLAVSAPQTGENVKVIPVSAMSSDITGATRLT